MIKRTVSQLNYTFHLERSQSTFVNSVIIEAAIMSSATKGKRNTCSTFPPPPAHFAKCYNSLILLFAALPVQAYYFTLFARPI